MLLNALPMWRLLALAVLLSCIGQAVPIPLTPETIVSADLSDAHVKYKHLKYVVNRDQYLPPISRQTTSSAGGGAEEGGNALSSILPSFWHSSSPSPDQATLSRPPSNDADELIVHESVRIEFDDEDIDISDDEGTFDEEFEEDLDDLLSDLRNSDDANKPTSPPLSPQPDPPKDAPVNNDIPSPRPPPQQPQDAGDVVMLPDCSKPDSNAGVDPLPSVLPSPPPPPLDNPTPQRTFVSDAPPSPDFATPTQQDAPTPIVKFPTINPDTPLDATTNNNNQGFTVPTPTPLPAPTPSFPLTKESYASYFNSLPGSRGIPPRRLGSNDLPPPYPTFGGPNSMQGFLNNNDNNNNNNVNGNGNNSGYFSFKK